jgi:HlyD family secretion protein
MFRIARGRLIELDAEIAEDALGTIAIGAIATVTLPTGAAFKSTVRHISPRVDPQTKLGRVRVALPVDAALRAGGFARASFTNKPDRFRCCPKKRCSSKPAAR